MDDKWRRKCRQVTGFGAWHIKDIQVSDGPHGVRAQEDGAKNNDSYEATCFPTASSLACSWNVDLIAKMAAGIAEEAKELGVSVILGPGVNIKRSPLCGRNFEYFSEDPYLAGELAAHYITAMQQNGVGTSLKHFAGNSQETHRMTSNSMIDDRALHEIYLSAFERAVKKAKPDTVMAAYNYINGSPACENAYLLTEILRKKWKYEGLVMSDWGACVDLPACLNAGMDVEMPDSCGNHFPELAAAVEKGKLSEKKLEEINRRIEQLNDKYKKNIILDKQDKKLSENTRKKNHSLAKRVEEDCAVLLKNDSFLPLKHVTGVLVIGDLAETLRFQGGGSSHIHTEHIDSFMEALASYKIDVSFVRGYKSNTFRRNGKLETEALTQVKKAAEKNMPILFFGGLTEIAEGEGYDRKSYHLPENQEKLLEQILEITDNIAFISISGSPYDLKQPSRCRALLQLYLGGEAVGAACAAIVTGEVNPSGKLAESIPYGEEDVPSYGYFGKQGEQKNRMDDVEYRESIFVGYRYYDTFQVRVRYCFGYGLSYTSFQYEKLQITEIQNGCFNVKFSVENTGNMEGAEIAELYVKNPDSNAFRAKRELRGFAKVYLKPGEKKEVELTLTERAFSVYQREEFQMIGGTYEIQVGASLQDIRLSQSVEVSGTEVQSALTIENKVPLSAQDFYSIYTYERTHFSNMVPGEFTAKNSLIQMAPYSPLARRWIRIGKCITKLMYPTKTIRDPEVRMMLEGILEGNIDSVCNQSGGLVKRKTIEKIIHSANRRDEG